jgi:hypothetical protein
MATKLHLFGLICYLVFGIFVDSHGQTGLNPIPSPSPVGKGAEDSIRASVYSWALSEVGVREKTGRNDGARIDHYNKTAGVPLRSPYCASFVWTAFVQSKYKPKGVKYPAQARQWFQDPKRLVLSQQSLRGNRRMMKLPKRGDVVGYYFRSGFNAISHIEILDRIDLEGEYIYCIGANTSAKNSASSVDRAGDGVYYVRRKLSSFYQIHNVISSP